MNHPCMVVSIGSWSGDVSTHPRVATRGRSCVSLQPEDGAASADSSRHRHRVSLHGFQATPRRKLKRKRRWPHGQVAAYPKGRETKCWTDSSAWLMRRRGRGAGEMAAVVATVAAGSSNVHGLWRATAGCDGAWCVDCCVDGIVRVCVRGGGCVLVARGSSYLLLVAKEALDGIEKAHLSRSRPGNGRARGGRRREGATVDGWTKAGQVDRSVSTDADEI